MLKALSFCHDSGCAEKRLDKKANLKMFDVTDWATNNYFHRPMCQDFFE